MTHSHVMSKLVEAHHAQFSARRNLLVYTDSVYTVRLSAALWRSARPKPFIHRSRQLVRSLSSTPRRAARGSNRELRLCTIVRLSVLD